MPDGGCAQGKWVGRAARSSCFAHVHTCLPRPVRPGPAELNGGKQSISAGIQRQARRSENRWRHLVDIDAKLAQIRLGQLNLGHELLVSLGHVVESHDVPTQTKEQVGAEGNESPEWELCREGGRGERGQHA